MNFFVFNDNDESLLNVDFHDVFMKYNDLKLFYENLILKYQNDGNYLLLSSRSASLYLSDSPNCMFDKVQKMMFYQYNEILGHGLYTKDFVTEKLSFLTTDKDFILRYCCNNTPFIVDCIFDQNSGSDVNHDSVLYVLIISYFESSIYIFEPKRHPLLLPCVILSDLSNSDFFYEYDLIFGFKDFFDKVNNITNVFLKNNPNYFSNLPSLCDIVNTDCTRIYGSFSSQSKKTYEKRINEITDHKNNRNVLFIVCLILSLIFLVIVILYKIFFLNYF